MILGRHLFNAGRDGGVVFLLHRDGKGTINSLIQENSGQRIGVVTYLRLPAVPSFKASTVVVCDVERLSPQAETTLFKTVNDWRNLPYPPRILNAPPRPMRRFRLLRSLYEKGINKKNIFRLDDPTVIDSICFPCFIRNENDHNIALPTPRILQNRDELFSEISRLTDQGRSLFGMVAIEFDDFKDKNGFYTKLSYFRVGDAIFPSHKFFSKDWFVKGFDQNLLDAHPRLADDEYSFLQSAPHLPLVKDVFETSGIEYGRIDFAERSDGVVHVFEINTNPNHPPQSKIPASRLKSFERTRMALRSALQALEASPEPVSLKWRRDEFWSKIRNRAKGLVQ